MIFTSKSGYKFEHQEDFKGKVIIYDPDEYPMHMDIDSLWEFTNHVIEYYKEQAAKKTYSTEKDMHNMLEELYRKLCGYSWYVGCYYDGEKIIVKHKNKPGSFAVREEMKRFYQFPVEFVCV